MPRAVLEIAEKAPFNGPITVRVDGQEQVVGYEVARNVFVCLADACRSSPEEVP